MNLYIAEIDTNSRDVISAKLVNTYDITSSLNNSGTNDSVSYEYHVSDILLIKGYIYWYDEPKWYVAIDIDREYEFYSEIQIVTEIKCLVRDNKLKQLINE